MFNYFLCCNNVLFVDEIRTAGNAHLTLNQSVEVNSAENFLDIQSTRKLVELDLALIVLIVVTFYLGKIKKP